MESRRFFFKLSQNRSQACLLPTSSIVNLCGANPGACCLLSAPFQVVNAREKIWLRLFNRSTRRIEHRGIVNPLPDGPVPLVWPAQWVEALRLDDGTKLVGWVEKQMNRSLKCSLPAYLFPPRSTFRDWVAGVEDDTGSISSAVISCRGFWESGRRNCWRNRDAFDGFRSEDEVRFEILKLAGSMKDCAFWTSEVHCIILAEG